MILAVDFDGTLHSGIYPNIGEPVENSIEYMNKLHQDGHYIIIWTCREGNSLLETINWLKEVGIPFDRVNDHEPKNKAQYGGTTRKVYADVYIDDRQIGGLPTWEEIYKYIISLTSDGDTGFCW